MKKKYCLILILIIALVWINLFYTDNITTIYHKIINFDFTLFNLRLPKVLACLFCGFGFGIAGVVFQKIFHNKLATPDIIGINTTASVALIVGSVVLTLSYYQLFIFTLITTIVMMIILFIMIYWNRTLNNILIAGLGIQAILSAIISLILVKSSQYDLNNIYRYLIGSLNNINWTTLTLAIIIITICCTILFYNTKSIDILEHKKDVAISLGVNVNLLIPGLIIISGIIISSCVMVVGPVVSLSFISGVISMLLFRHHHQLLGGGLIGMIIMLLASMLTQFILPIKLPIGIITGLIATPLLLFTIKRGSND